MGWAHCGPYKYLEVCMGVKKSKKSKITKNGFVITQTSIGTNIGCFGGLLMFLKKIWARGGTPHPGDFTLFQLGGQKLPLGNCDLELIFSKAPEMTQNVTNTHQPRLKMVFKYHVNMFWCPLRSFGGHSKPRFFFFFGIRDTSDGPGFQKLFLTFFFQSRKKKKSQNIAVRNSVRIFCRIFCRIFVRILTRKYLVGSRQPERVSGPNLRENVLYVHAICLGVLPCPQ